MRIEKSIRLRGLGITVLGALLLGLVLACSLFNQAPVARIEADVLSGGSPLVVRFDATASSDVDGIIIAYEWDFGDGDPIMAPSVQHTFITTDAIEVFTVTLTVTDEDGATSQATQTIEVRLDGDQPTGTGVPTARFTASKFIGVSPLTVTFDATDSTSGGGTITAYNWDFADGTQGTGITVTHTFIPDPETTTTYPATLFVWNSNGEMDAEQLEIVVIVPVNDTGDEAPVADVFVTGPDIIFEPEPGDRPNIPALFEVKFDPRGSYADAGHGIEYYVWEFGDGDLQIETSDLEVTHIYAVTAPSQTLVAKLTVFDDQGYENTAVVNITLTQD